MYSLLFFGTEEFAKSILKQLLDSQQFSIIGVVTKSDQEIGRKKEIHKSPVKLLAEKYNLSIYQPESLKNWSLDIDRWDVSVVCQYGKIIPKNIIDIPKFGTINVHTSLLPNYRGASPIQSAIINGETETGITIMLMDEKMDHGPILAQEKISIDPDDSYPTLSEKMMSIAGKLLLQTLDQWTKKEIQPHIQDESQVTLCKLLERDDGKIDWQNMTADQIYNLYRGTFPWPGVWTIWEGKRLKLTEIRKVPSENLSELFLVNVKPTSSERVLLSNFPGLVVTLNKKTYIGVKDGAIELIKVQLEGKKEMDIKSFVNGYQILKTYLS
jgi:methionyl-tRNA formyltransferase